MNHDSPQHPGEVSDDQAPTSKSPLDALRPELRVPPALPADTLRALDGMRSSWSGRWAVVASTRPPRPGLVAPEHASRARAARVAGWVLTGPLALARLGVALFGVPVPGLRSALTAALLVAVAVGCGARTGHARLAWWWVKAPFVTLCRHDDGTIGLPKTGEVALLGLVCLGFGMLCWQFGPKELIGQYRFRRYYDRPDWMIVPFIVGVVLLGWSALRYRGQGDPGPADPGTDAAE